jgi:hypothetical protein
MQPQIHLIRVGWGGTHPKTTEYGTQFWLVWRMLKRLRKPKCTSDDDITNIHDINE